ncbi:farnesyl diphosphate synthase [Yoonia tamlensis]|uniref:Geranylgeranyl diphosphate synthase n=1 Tax=Yoonia tamlensis TaxID=390270 RepID=A0A1I6HCR7_9RHOB|nr:farnesyl diphosphate synthase [Yoonia tamlensis]SFR52316.1 farnesyl diphosphate synthase [Yoonia tamlensis]
MTETFQNALNEAAAQAQAYIAQALAGQTGSIAQGMIYATQGGKAMRAFLVLESARLHGLTTALPAAAAIECMHAYSLVHDDLPCMDDDDLRRGQPTVHVKWDEATAVLVGDALQAMAFDCVLHVDATAEARICLAQTLAQASGLRGMVGGQAADIAAETAATPLTLDEITALQAGKTGALINWAAMAGARIAQAETSALKAYGDALGLAFQIADDILDVTGDAATMGKAVGKDAAAGKATFVSLLGLDGAKRRAHYLVQEACDALSPYGDDAETLKEAARFVIARTH